MLAAPPNTAKLTVVSSRGHKDIFESVGMLGGACVAARGTHVVHPGPEVFSRSKSGQKTVVNNFWSISFFVILPEAVSNPS